MRHVDQLCSRPRCFCASVSGSPTCSVQQLLAMRHVDQLCCRPRCFCASVSGSPPALSNSCCPCCRPCCCPDLLRLLQVGADQMADTSEKTLDTHVRDPNTYIRQQAARAGADITVLVVPWSLPGLSYGLNPMKAHFQAVKRGAAGMGHCACEVRRLWQLHSSAGCWLHPWVARECRGAPHWTRSSVSRILLGSLVSCVTNSAVAAVVSPQALAVRKLLAGSPA